MSQPKKKNETLFPWVGNKKFYIDFIKEHVPKKYDTYIEPFLGSAVVFQELKPEKAILSDNSAYLMDIFQCMKKNSKLFYGKVQKNFQDNSAELHANCKKDICGTKSIFARSAMFYFLLRTSLYSFVCLKTDEKSFTCCYKSTGKPILIKEELYWNLCDALSKDDVSVKNSDFAEIIDMGKKGDFIFIDPPYMNLNRPSRKIYNSFKQQDHERLVDKILAADKRGCYIMMFNHNHPFLAEKLVNFNVISTDHKNLRKSRSQFSDYEEVMYTNYD